MKNQKNVWLLIAKMGGGFIKKRKKAFTLIELLAIIVILAIIAVITVPIILNIIENSRKGAATDSAYGYKDAVNKWYVQELAKPNNQNLKLDKTYTVESDGKLTGKFEGDESQTKSVTIDISGTVPTGGSLTYENNVLTSGTLIIGDYTATYSNGSFTAVKTSEASNISNNNSNNNGGGDETPTNSNLTTYTYKGPGSTEFGILDAEWSIYIRNDGEKNEVCGVFGSSQEDIVCMTSAYYNSSYSDTGDYYSDFEDCEDSEDPYTYSSTCVKGYTKTKADEITSVGASCQLQSDQGDYSLVCYANNFLCGIADFGSIDCSYDGGVIGINSDGSIY